MASTVIDSSFAPVKERPWPRAMAPSMMYFGILAAPEIYESHAPNRIALFGLETMVLLAEEAYLWLQQ
jgi:hypothetical protein